MFTSLEDPGDHEHVTYGDNSRGKVLGLGRIAISKDLSISNVLFVEALSFNLISIAQLCDLGLTCAFDKNGVVVTHEKDKSLVFTGFRHGNIYLVDFSSKQTSTMTCLFTKSSLGWLWHRRIAHIGMSNLKKAHKRGMITGLKDVTFDKNKLQHIIPSRRCCLPPSRSSYYTWISLVQLHTRALVVTSIA